MHRQTAERIVILVSSIYRMKNMDRLGVTNMTLLISKKYMRSSWEILESIIPYLMYGNCLIVVIALCRGIIPLSNKLYDVVLRQLWMTVSLSRHEI